MTGSNDEVGKVLVVGAGVAGIRSALDLAEAGYEVVLTESSPAIGGVLSKLDFQFPTDHCGMCRMLPFVGRESASQFCMRRSLFHDNITILPNTEVLACAGEPGRFEVTLRERARWVDTDVCIGEGECVAVCPEERPDAFNEGMTRRKAIYRPVPHNLQNLFVIDREACTRCGECVRVCPVGAIDLEAEDRERTLAVGAVVLAAGSGLWDGEADPGFLGYGQSPAVVTSLEFERIVSSTGTYLGSIRRPGDGKEVKRIAWLQCVGSRNRATGRDYCSAVCCMFALKEAVLAKERGGPETSVALFYMDLRTYGKDYYRYRLAAEDRGVRLVRCRAHSVRPAEDGSAVIRYFDSDGRAREESFDLVVLATGQRPPREISGLREVFGFELTGSGFVATDETHKVRTTAPGVFVCGSMTGLKDISEAVMEGSAAALEASTLLRSKGLDWRRVHAAPEERDVSREAPRVAVLLCRWPLKEGPLGVDFELLSSALRDDPRVVAAPIVDEVCRAGLDEARGALERSKANRVLFVACLPYQYRTRLKDLARSAGLNPALVEVLDLRGHVRGLLHREPARSLQSRATELVRARVDEVAAKDAVRLTSVRVVPRALVVGGGLTGMQASLSLSRHGLEVVLVEKGRELGGHALELARTLDGIDPRALAARLAEAVRADRGITVMTGAEVVASRGSVGRYSSIVRRDGQGVEVAHGATIVATGGREAGTTAHGYGSSDRIVTQGELERRLAEGSVAPDELGTVVMIQCVGSRERGEREYCSRLCCASALKNARSVLELAPGARVVVLYRDMMTYGFMEQHYTAARAKGVIFASFEPERPPRVTVEDGRPKVVFHDSVLCSEVEVSADLLALSTGMLPNPASELAEVLGLELNADGFFKEVDYKWRPLETLKEGVFLAGLAHSPRSIPEALVMAEAAAERALTVLSQEQVATARLVSTVRRGICASCEVCVELCPYEARRLDPREGRIVVDELACQGCGICVAGCPSKAASFAGRIERQVIAGLDAALSTPARARTAASTPVP